MKRFGIEFLIILVLILVAVGIWIWKDRETSHAIVAEQRAAEERVAAVVASGDQWARTLAQTTAQTSFRAFAAGIHPLILGGGRSQVLDQAIGAALELPAVTFVHVLGPDGTVMASSDRKLQTTGELPAAASWVMGTNEMTDRAGDTPGTLEIAAPVLGPAGPFAYLWMGYDTDHLLNRTRPADWPAAAPTTEQPPETGPVETESGGDL